MKKKDKYVAYVSTYTMKEPYGIKIFDVDIEKGRLYEKKKVAITNSSYITISHDQKFLYSITDAGVESYRIHEDTGDLECIGTQSINGMRGCYLSTDYFDRHIVVAGYHDGKMTVLRINEDGSVGSITDEVYHKGLGSVAERNFRPHINCVKFTRDNKYLLAADLGLDHTNVYRFDHASGKVKLVDVLRSEIESAPRHVKFTKDGRFLYIVHELKNIIDVYSYEDVSNDPQFEKIGTYSTLNKDHAGGSAACALNFSLDDNHLMSSNAGDNSVIIYAVNHEDGSLDKCLCLPISGEYPKDANFFPDKRHIVSLNHENDTMTTFALNLEQNTIVMNGPEIPVDKPNCICFFKIKQ